ncbi:MAG: type II toxin-antitoxin system ParD family antitoxin [Pseudomonadota bacterium]
MARNPSISFTEQQLEFVQALVASGRYRGVSEVVRAGLRLLEDEEARMEAERQSLRAEIEAGLSDVANDRVRDFDPARIVEQGEALRSQNGASE